MYALKNIDDLESLKRLADKLADEYQQKMYVVVGETRKLETNIHERSIYTHEFTTESIRKQSLYTASPRSDGPAGGIEDTVVSGTDVLLSVQ